jgi:hypothetical protein
VKQWEGHDGLITLGLFMGEHRWLEHDFLPGDAAKVAALILGKPAVAALITPVPQAAGPTILPLTWVERPDGFHNTFEANVFGYTFVVSSNNHAYFFWTTCGMETITKSTQHDSLEAAKQAAQATWEAMLQSVAFTNAEADDDDPGKYLDGCAAADEGAPQDADYLPVEPTAGPVASTHEFTLRAMAANYADGHSWDHLDGEACLNAANEIKALRQLADDRLQDAARLTQEKADYWLRIQELEKAQEAGPTLENSRFDEWSLSDFAGQCRMQSRDNLDPEYSEFMTSLSKRLSELSKQQASEKALGWIRPFDVDMIRGSITGNTTPVMRERSERASVALFLHPKALPTARDTNAPLIEMLKEVKDTLTSLAWEENHSLLEKIAATIEGHKKPK